MISKKIAMTDFRKKKITKIVIYFPTAWGLTPGNKIKPLLLAAFLLLLSLFLDDYSLFQGFLSFFPKILFVWDCLPDFVRCSKISAVRCAKYKICTVSIGLNFDEEIELFRYLIFFDETLKWFLAGSILKLCQAKVLAGSAENCPRLTQ